MSLDGGGAQGPTFSRVRTQTDPLAPTGPLHPHPWAGPEGLGCGRPPVPGHHQPPSLPSPRRRHLPRGGREGPGKGGLSAWPQWRGHSFPACPPPGGPERPSPRPGAGGRPREAPGQAARCVPSCAARSAFPGSGSRAGASSRQPGRARRAAAGPPPRLRPHQQSMRRGSPRTPLRLAQRRHQRGHRARPAAHGSWAPVGAAPFLPGGTGHLTRLPNESDGYPTPTPRAAGSKDQDPSCTPPAF